LISCAWVLPSRLILFDLTFSLVPVPLFLLASVVQALLKSVPRQLCHSLLPYNRGFPPPPTLCIKPRTSYVLGKISTIEPHLQPSSSFKVSEICVQIESFVQKHSYPVNKACEKGVFDWSRDGFCIEFLLHFLLPFLPALSPEMSLFRMLSEHLFGGVF
jgi:hypothetical protein